MNRPHFVPVEFIAGEKGSWQVEKILPLRGPTLSAVPRIERVEGAAGTKTAASWILRGATSNIRYAEKAELSELIERQATIGRVEADHAALIPIRKAPEWWALAQDERRVIMEERSRHISIGKEYVSSVARRLYHCQEKDAPFDFLTWFEFAAEDAAVFEELVERLRKSEEWKYVDREVEIQVVKAPREILNPKSEI
ncbi:MAG: chlorite dismutase family protein [Candidatus Hydrogenedentota bacterium]